MKLWFLYDVCLSMFGIAVFGALVYALFFRLAGIRITTIQIGSFGTPFQWKSKSCVVKFGWFPLHSCVEFDIPGFRARPLWLRLGLSLCCPLILFGLACIFLGLASGGHHFLTAWWEWPLGAFEPHAVAQPLIGQWHAIFAVSKLQAIAILAIKIAAFDLLPMGSAFNRVCLECLRAYEDHHWATRVSSGLLLAGFATYLLWTYATIRFALS